MVLERGYAFPEESEFWNIQITAWPKAGDGRFPAGLGIPSKIIVKNTIHARTCYIRSKANNRLTSVCYK